MTRTVIPPELADGGYWYVVPVVPDPEEGGRTPGQIPGGWCAWYGEVDGTEYAVVRFADPVQIPTAVNVPVSGVVKGYGKKPFGRIRGR